MTNELLALVAVLQLLMLVTVLAFGLLQWRSDHRQARVLSEAEAVLESWYRHTTRTYREKKANEDLVPDALTWVARQVKADVAQPLQIAGVLRIVPDLRAIELKAEDGRRVVIAPMTAAQLRRAQRRKNGIQTFVDAPLLNGGQRVVSVERSLLTSDYFDLEAAQAGAKLKVPGWDEAPRLYFHILPSYR